jgi:hypothetical protein
MSIAQELSRQALGSMQSMLRCPRTVSAREYDAERRPNFAHEQSGMNSDAAAHRARAPEPDGTLHSHDVVETQHGEWAGTAVRALRTQAGVHRGPLRRCRRAEYSMTRLRRLGNSKSSCCNRSTGSGFVGRRSVCAMAVLDEERASRRLLVRRSATTTLLKIQGALHGE